MNKPGYMSREQVKQLADENHVIGSHTYDHKNVKTYTPDDWVEQVQQPSQQLQNITGKQVEYFLSLRFMEQRSHSEIKRS